MAYMEEHFEKRIDPSRLRDGVVSVISVILNYFTTEQQTDPDAPVLSKYAYGRDYHHVIRKRLRKLLHFLNDRMGPVKGHPFVDSAPVLDRAWAARAGLGWIGKNSNLISPVAGSFVFIGSLMVDIQLEEDTPMPDLCGTCEKCLQACPTSAIVAPRVVDARRCISCLTIEHKGEIDPLWEGSFRNRVFGCDICQDVCPWNRKKARLHDIPEFSPVKGLLEMDRNDWYQLDENRFEGLFKGSAVRRAGYRGLRRNLAFIAHGSKIPKAST
jgi:epoxyqueuosine reductase